jgi:ABC-type Na+ transport system ATPase subunit NatA
MVEIAKAVVEKPKILNFDEPSAVCPLKNSNTYIISLTTSNLVVLCRIGRRPLYDGWG